MHKRDNMYISKRKVVVLTAVIAIILISYGPIQVNAKSCLRYEIVDVYKAHSMINSDQYDDILILDVRSPDEFRLTHLENAISIPFDHLEPRIDELSETDSNAILIYCRTGKTSQQAAEILVVHGFTNIFSMAGGITKWLEAGFEVSTASHFVSVDDESLFIEPLLAYMNEGFLSGSNCTACDSSTDGCDAIQRYDNVVLEQDEHRTVTLTTFEYDNRVIEAITTATFLWRYTEVDSEVNRSIAFTSIESVTSDLSMSLALYEIQYLVEHDDYTLKLETMLNPQNEESYSRSFTTLLFEPVQFPNVVSVEVINLGVGIRLSNLYDYIARCVAELGKEYESYSEDYFQTLACRYRVIVNELETLSFSAKTYLNEYDRCIVESIVLLNDEFSWPCIISNWASCYGLFEELTLACVLGAIIACVNSLILFPICMAPLLEGCGIVDAAFAIFCASFAITYCTFTPPPPPPGGGCPILTVYNGSEYVSEGLLNIHAQSDIKRTFFLDTTPTSLNNKYMMRLTEHPKTISNIDQVRLFVRRSDGLLMKLPLVSATHSVEGNVLRLILKSDDLRTVTLGADHNNGSSQYLDLQFAACNGFSALKFILVIEGYNSVIK